MADDADRTLARLAVDAGFLTKDEAMRYWQQCQSPGSPRFIQLLVQSKRLSPADLNQLRTLWQRASGPAPALGAPPSNGAVAVAPPPAVTTTSPPGNLKSTDDGSWEEALEKDTQLARALFARGLVTQERLRECRALQLQHRLRLGLVLVKKGYVEQAAIDETSATLRPSQPGPAFGAPARPAPPAMNQQQPGAPGLGASTRLQRPPGSANTNPFVPTPSPGGPIDQDSMPTLNVPPGSFPPGGPMGSPMTPRAPLGPEDAIPTILGGGAASVEELNPFALGLIGGPDDAPAGLPAAHRRPDPATPKGPLHGESPLSRDELNAFDDVPLGAPPRPGAAQGPYLPAGSAGDGDITMPPGYAPPGAEDLVQANPAKRPSQAEANLPDSGGEKPAAPKKKKATTTRQTSSPHQGGSSRLVLMLVAGAVLIVVAAVAAWGLGVFG